MQTDKRKQIQLLVLPGLGGDRRMAYPQLSLPYQLITPDYFALNRNESLSNFAKRFGEHLIATHTIDRSRPLIIAGYSFGSAIAQELAQWLDCKGLILIGGLRCGRELHPFIRWFGIKIAPRLPLIVYYLVGLALPLAMRAASVQS